MNDNINTCAVKTYDCLIIGGGPTGITAALYLARANCKVAIIESSAPGGKMVNTSEIENYPGFESILGPDLSLKMLTQVTKLGVDYIGAEVIKIDLDLAPGLKRVITTDREIISAKTVIIATGTVERKLGIPGEAQYYGHGVSYCAVCDGAFYNNQDVAVVGGGNSAFQESLFLTRFAKKVYLIHRRQGFRASPGMIRRVKNNKKIEMILDTVVTAVHGNQEEANAITIKNVNTGETRDLTIGCLFPYIGADPITKFVADLNITDDNGYIVVNRNCETKIEGIYAAGDVTDTPLRQIATAVGAGALAGQKVIEYLDHLESLS